MDKEIDILPNTLESEKTIGDQAKEIFHKPPEHYNCAQSILKAFGECESIEEFKAFGGGRAPDGCCGALFAAKSLASNEREKEILTELFIQKVGSCKCKEIRALKITPCAECVKIAADCLSEMELSGAF